MRGEQALRKSVFSSLSLLEHVSKNPPYDVSDTAAETGSDSVLIFGRQWTKGDNHQHKSVPEIDDSAISCL